MDFVCYVLFLITIFSFGRCSNFVNENEVICFFGDSKITFLALGTVARSLNMFDKPVEVFSWFQVFEFLGKGGWGGGFVGV